MNKATIGPTTVNEGRQARMYRRLPELRPLLVGSIERVVEQQL